MPLRPDEVSEVQAIVQSIVKREIAEAIKGLKKVEKAEEPEDKGSAKTQFKKN